MMTAAEAWRMIGEAFEARAEHPEIQKDWSATDIAWDGLCRGVDRLYYRLGENSISYDRKQEMYEKIAPYIGPEGGYLDGQDPAEPGGPELRATLAYLFAEEAAA